MLLSRGFPLVAHTGARPRKNAALCFPRIQGLDGGFANHDSRRTTAPARDLGFPFRLTLPTVAPGLNSWGQELLRFVSTARHSLPTGERCSQGVSARVSPDRCKFPATFTAKAQLHLSGSFHTRTSAAERNHRSQVSQTYSRNSTNIATRGAHRQWLWVASEEEWWAGVKLTNCRMGTEQRSKARLWNAAQAPQTKRSLACARDFGARLRRRASTSTC